MILNIELEAIDQVKPSIGQFTNQFTNNHLRETCVNNLLASCRHGNWSTKPHINDTSYQLQLPLLFCPFQSSEDGHMDLVRSVPHSYIHLLYYC